MRNNNQSGTALIITMIYLMIVAIVCAVALSFSSGHYKLLTDRVDRFQNVYYSEGGLYLGIVGSTGLFYIESGNTSSTVGVSQSGGNVNSSGVYEHL